MHHDGEARLSPSEALEHGGEAFSRPKLASTASAGMNDQKPSVAVPAEPLKHEPGFGDEHLPGRDRRAHDSIRSRADRAQQMAPHLLIVRAHRRGDHGFGYERPDPPGEVGLTGAKPRHQVAALTKVGRAPLGPFALTLDAIGLLEERGEPERVEVDESIDDVERGEEAADPGLGRNRKRFVGPAPSRRAERRDRQQDIAQRAGMDDEGQRRSNASAASWRRPFVASAVPV